MDQLSILNKVFKMYGQYGIKVFTMDDIAQACGISKKTLYSNFENKYELVQTLVANTTAHFMSEYSQLRQKATNAVEEVYLTLQMLEDVYKTMQYRMLDEMERYYYEIWRKVDAFMMEEIKDFIKTNIKRGASEGLFMDVYDADIISRMRVHQLNSIHKHTSVPDLHNALYQTTRHYLYGLATEAGRQEVDKIFTSNNHNR